MTFGWFFRSNRKIRQDARRDLDESIELLKDAGVVLDSIEEASLDGENDWWRRNCLGIMNCNGKPRNQE